MIMTFAQWLASTNGGAGPTRHWPLSDTTGTAMVAATGGINGTYQNTADVELNIVDALSEKWVGFNAAAGAPGHATIATALQSAAFTAMALVQFDWSRASTFCSLLAVARSPASSRSRSSTTVRAASSRACGPSTLRLRSWPTWAERLGPVGTACALFYVRRSTGSQEVWLANGGGGHPACADPKQRHAARQLGRPSGRDVVSRRLVYWH